MAVTVAASGTHTSDLGTFTVTIASPGVFTKASNQLANGDALIFSTTGGLPTGLVAGTTYYVVNLATDGAGKFRVAATQGGADINTSVSQSGVHSIASVEHILFDSSAAATYELATDLAAQVSGDVTVLRMYRMVLSGGTRRIFFAQTIPGAQTTNAQGWVSIPGNTGLADAGALRFTATFTGVTHAYPWSVEKFG